MMIRLIIRRIGEVVGIDLCNTKNDCRFVIQMGKAKKTAVLPATRCDAELRMWLEQIAVEEGKELGELIRDTMNEKVVRWMKGKVTKAEIAPKHVFDLDSDEG